MGSYNYSMKRLTSPCLLLTITLTVATFVLSGPTLTARGQTEADLWQEEFNEDPTISEASIIPSTSASSPLVIDSKNGQTNLSVETTSPISPYFGAVKKPQDAPDDMYPLLGRRSDNPLDNYSLETGVGLRVNERTDVNLGYRFNKSPSLIDSQGSDDPGQGRGDLRFSLEIKLPF